MNLNGLRIVLIGPLPPPEGGMANQTRQLAELLENEGARVTLVRTNEPYRPRWVRRVRGLRALFRLAPYAARLWHAAGSADLFHVMANSGWSWHFFAAPAVKIARLRGVPVVVNYRGGEAARFLERAGAGVARTMRSADAVVVPSGFLKDVFARHGVPSLVVPNIVDLERFHPGTPAARTPRLIVARNLESIYDNATALRAFALIHQQLPDACLTIAGSGPEEEMLRALAKDLGVGKAVEFCGRVSRDRVAELYRLATVALNPSRVDNMPNSVLEAMASGVPVVSTDAGGVPYILRHEVTGLIVPVGEPVAMAAAALRILQDRRYASHLRAAAFQEVQQYAWTRIKDRWAALYASVLPNRGMETRAA